MDITAFLTRRGQISLQALLCAYGFLSESQNQRGYIEFDEIHQGLRLGADLSAAEVDVHSAIIYESAVIPIQFSDRPRKMKFHVDAEGVSSFIINIIRTIQRKTQGKFSHSLDNFRRDVDHHFAQEMTSMTMQIPNTHGFSHRAPMEMFNNMMHGCSMYPKYGQGPTYVGPLYNEMEAVINKDLFETSEQGIRFLAEIRRGGMDILFPQIKHDKVLSIIFAVFTLVKSTAHKELIDLVMAVKECGSVSNLENVSKTKVRGVIALLKLAAIIETHGGSTEKAPVNLTLSLTIDSYETLREQHDEFISNFGATQPVVWRDELYWGKLIWGRLDDKRRGEKLREIEQFMPKLLNSNPLRPIVTLAGPSKTGEIYMTKESAMDSTKLQDAFNFKFDNDKEKNDVDTDLYKNNNQNDNKNNDGNKIKNSSIHGNLGPGSALNSEVSSVSSYNGRILDSPSPAVPPSPSLNSIPGKKERTPLVSMGASDGLSGTTGPPSFLFNLDLLNIPNYDATLPHGKKISHLNDFALSYQNQKLNQTMNLNSLSPQTDSESSNSVLSQLQGQSSLSDLDHNNNNNNNNSNTFQGFRSSQLTPTELQELRGRRPTMIELGQLHQPSDESFHDMSMSRRRHSLGDDPSLESDPSSYENEEWRKLDIFATPKFDESDPRSLAQYRRHQQALLEADSSHHHRGSFMAKNNEFEHYGNSNAHSNLNSRHYNGQGGMSEKMWRERLEEANYDHIGRSQGSYPYHQSAVHPTSSLHFESKHGHQHPSQSQSYSQLSWQQQELRHLQQQQHQRLSFDGQLNLQLQREQQHRLNSHHGGQPLSSFPSRAGPGVGSGISSGPGPSQRPLSSTDLFNATNLKQQQLLQQQHLMQLQQQQHQQGQAMVSPRGFTSISPGAPNVPYNGNLERDDMFLSKHYQLPQQQHFSSNSFHN